MEGALQHTAPHDWAPPKTEPHFIPNFTSEFTQRAVVVVPPPPPPTTKKPKPGDTSHNGGAAGGTGGANGAGAGGGNGGGNGGGTGTGQ